MLCGTLAPDSGDVLIDNINLRDDPELARTKIGFLPDTPPLYPELTVDEYLDYCAKLRRMSAAEIPRGVAQVRNRTGLEVRGSQRISGLSRGYRQRLGVAQAIIHRPALLVLDEPTSGLDPRQIEEIRTLIRAQAQTSAVIFSTHLLSEARALCDRVVVIHEGEIAHQSAVDDSLESTFFDITGISAA